MCPGKLEQYTSQRHLNSHLSGKGCHCRNINSCSVGGSLLNMFSICSRQQSRWSSCPASLTEFTPVPRRLREYCAPGLQKTSPSASQPKQNVLLRPLHQLPSIDIHTPGRQFPGCLFFKTPGQSGCRACAVWGLYCAESAGGFGFYAPLRSESWTRSGDAVESFGRCSGIGPLVVAFGSRKRHRKPE